MSILEIKNLSHVYDAKSLFDKANLAVSGGDHSGIVGLNGRQLLRHNRSKRRRQIDVYKNSFG